MKSLYASCMIEIVMKFNFIILNMMVYNEIIQYLDIEKGKEIKHFRSFICPVALGPFYGCDRI